MVPSPPQPTLRNVPAKLLSRFLFSNPRYDGDIRALQKLPDITRESSCLHLYYECVLPIQWLGSSSHSTQR